MERKGLVAVTLTTSQLPTTSLEGKEPSKLYYGVLGSLVVHDNGRLVTPTAPKAATVLSILLLRANHVVLAESLMEEIWGETPPSSAASTVQTYIYHLRCSLGRETIDTHPRGYSLSLGDTDCDLFEFRSRVRQGRRLLELGRAHDAVTEFRAGLSLWRGHPLDNLPAGSFLQPHISHLEEERRRATQLRVEAEFVAGHHRELIGELKVLVADDPYNEWLHARLIEALSLSGRRRDALAAYQSLRRLLAEDLGLRPTKELRDLETRVLAG